MATKWCPMCKGRCYAGDDRLRRHMKVCGGLREGGVRPPTPKARYVPKEHR